MKQNTQLTLASASPRRSELLAQIGLEFSVVVTDVDETRQDGESPGAFVKRLAVEKALAGMQISGLETPVLGADTVVLLDDRILGKPVNRQEAADMLRLMSNREHLVLSAVALALSPTQVDVVLNTTRVVFAALPDEFIDWYCSTDEPLDKAGAYAIQGRAGQYVARVDGSYSGVMGLPLYETGVLLRSAGVLS
jgi:septum formation protein